MDYCTSWFEGWWADCCMAHDADYAAQVLKSLADSQLGECVSHALPAIATGNPVASALFAGLSAVIGFGMYKAVSVFGGKYYRAAASPTPGAKSEVK